MDIHDMLNSKGPSSVEHHQQQQHQPHHQPRQTNRPGVDVTPMRNGTGYPSPTEPGQPTTYPYEDPAPYGGMYHMQKSEMEPSSVVPETSPTDGTRSFPCQTCNKGFARRSDLARHERIHSGDRPHVCPEPGCGKPFIQRSALTVHMRVHSGEKPHMCERCGKPFSDSSSLARHRRIHSGQRPYKCPFADCQKNFTRRTTLTRHQMNHTGTVEEAAAKTAGLLAERSGSISGQQQPRRTSDESTASYSDTGSAISVGTPTDSERSLTPSSTAADIGFPSHIPPIPAPISLQQPGMGYHGSDSLPLHFHPMRQPGLQQPSPRSSPSASSPTLSAFGGVSNHPRPSHVTSHPTGPSLPVLEPPAGAAYHDLRSGSGSPHMGSTGSSGWNSPLHPGGPGALPPSPMGSGEYSLYSSEPPPQQMHTQAPSSHGALPMYLGGGARRPSSSEPELYEMRPRLAGTGGGGGWGSGL